eukprot:TRINITY_DN9800_c0_g1_i1.p2 TRINITY_DN9800_c0_g1~~TRINITY_DN9800_c0_g1_i1.p2  ORF type:complete len:69 (-),score=8.83 TRINITY_DN9800_c0_g1_i1:67-273(-)
MHLTGSSLVFHNSCWTKRPGSTDWHSQTVQIISGVAESRRLQKNPKKKIQDIHRRLHVNFILDVTSLV